MATQILGKVAYTSRGAYDSSFSYEINDVVTYNGSSYVSLKETKGNLPTNENYWMLLAQKGDTYEVTEDDLNNIANQITEDANSLFNQNVDTKTEEFNTNASNKTNDFNSNVTSKTETFNTNAETKTTSFNENATTKLNTYDENATTKLSEYNTNADTRLQEFNDNADSYNERITANEDNIVENTTSIRRLENNIFEAGEATGESINIQDSVLSELTGFRAKAVNTQKTTEGTSLINFLNYSSISGYTTINFENDILTASCTKGEYRGITYDIKEICKNNLGKKLGFYFKNINKSNSDTPTMVQIIVKYNNETPTSYHPVVTSTFQKNTYTIPSDLSNISDISLVIQVNNSTTSFENTLTIEKPMLYLGEVTDDVEYEPYTGGLPSPSPSFPSQIPVIEAGEVVEVESVGDNTFKFAELNSGHSGLTYKTNADGSLTINGTATVQGSIQALFSISFPNVKKGDTLGVKVVSGSITSIAGNVKPRLVMYDDKYSTNLIITNLNQMSIGEFKYSKAYADFVPYYSYIDWNVGDVFDNFTIQGFYSRSGETEYTPYVESKITTSVPDGEFVGATNTIADEFYTEYNEEDKKEHLYLAKNVGRKILDGTENWAMSFGTGMFHLTSYIPSLIYKTLCSHFTYNSVKTGVYNTIVDGEFATNGGANENKNIYLKYTVFSTIDEWKAYLAEQHANGNPVIVQYDLANPYSIDLGAIDNLKTYTDVTNILNNSSIPFNMTANYYRNFISTIRNLQVNNGALQTELADLESRLSALETSVSNLQVSQVNESEVI